jgi:hypothetical protein
VSCQNYTAQKERDEMADVFYRDNSPKKDTEVVCAAFRAAMMDQQKKLESRKLPLKFYDSYALYNFQYRRNEALERMIPTNNVYSVVTVSSTFERFDNIPDEDKHLMRSVCSEIGI